MFSNGKYRVILVVVLCFILLSLSVDYATLNQNLTINSSAKINSNTWNVVLSNSSCSTTGNAEAGNPTVTGTNITFNGLVLKGSGDTITCTFTVSNLGSVDAQLSNITNTTPEYVGVGSSKTADETLISTNVSYAFTYSDGTVINNSNPYSLIEAGDNRSMKMVASYSGNETPTNDVVIKNVGIQLTYTQS